MIVDVYQSAIGNKYFAVPTGADLLIFSEVLEQFGPDYRTMKVFETKMNLSGEHPNVGFNTAVIVNCLESQGYAAYEVNLTVTAGVQAPALARPAEAEVPPDEDPTVDC